MVFHSGISIEMCIFFSSYNLDVNRKSKLSTLQDAEKVRHLEGQVQELENLISSLQQQLKETKENYGAEIHCLQERLQAVSESTVQPRYLSTYNFIQQYF